MPRRATAGFTVVELAIIVCVAGVILAVFVPTFAAQLRTSKTAEAAGQLQRMHRAAAAYFEGARTAGDDSGVGACLPAAAGPSPERPSEDPVEVQFSDPSTPGHETWRALGFTGDRKLRYRYSFLPAASGCGLDGRDGSPLATYRAEGDLDGDGKFSTFERNAVATPEGKLQLDGVLYTVDRVE